MEGAEKKKKKMLSEILGEGRDLPHGQEALPAVEHPSSSPRGFLHSPVPVVPHPSCPTLPNSFASGFYLVWGFCLWRLAEAVC